MINTIGPYVSYDIAPSIASLGGGAHARGPAGVFASDRP